MKKLLLAVPVILMMPLESFAGAWTLPKRRMWLKSAIFYQATDRRFCDKPWSGLPEELALHDFPYST